MDKRNSAAKNGYNHDINAYYQNPRATLLANDAQSTVTVINIKKLIL